ncbi:MAG: phosphotriesterase [Nitrososphaerota archaeon]|nr:phosphotriesterase [Candidatus Calditenuaceae archaeon]MDW8073021.1 phosphotriesterase [Nitrososphaerota archaeon]
MPKIRTVLGDISAAEFGLALTHEHIICDFIGADKVSRDRYDLKEVLDTMLPYLNEIHKLGVRGFVDCTPAFIGRDPRLLADLSRSSGIHILTNTGLYKEPYLPRYAFEYSADDLMECWAREIEEGVEDEIVRARFNSEVRFPIKAGFIKIAVNPGHIVPIQQKIVKAAARCSIATGAAIVCHTAHGVAALELLRIADSEGLDLSKLIVAHSDAIDDLGVHLEILRQGAWVSYDGIREATVERSLRLVLFVREHGFERQLLLSQDSGWYNVGEPRGGNIRGYSYLVKEFIPLLLGRGLGRDFVERVLIDNPSRVFQIK